MIEHAVGVVSLERFAEIDRMDHDDMGSLLLDTMAENAKLRELVKDLYEDMWASGEWLEPYEQRMRELGIEVDE